MNNKPFVVLNKTTHKPKVRKLSESSSDSEQSPPVAQPISSSSAFQVPSNIRVEGGFTTILASSVFVFPTRRLSPEQREAFLKTFAEKLYNISGEQTELKVIEVFRNLSSNIQVKCNKIYLNEHSQARLLSLNAENVSPDSLFRTPDAHLAPSTPGPRVARVPNINTPHTVEDSLKIKIHLGLSDDECRYVRGISLIGLASEYSMKCLKARLLGNSGKGWLEADKMSLRKWYRDGRSEGLNRGKQEVVIVSIPKLEIKTALQHWTSCLTERGEFVELQSFENCPPILYDAVALILGNDSGKPSQIVQMLGVFFWGGEGSVRWMS